MVIIIFLFLAWVIYISVCISIEIRANKTHVEPIGKMEERDVEKELQPIRDSLKIKLHTFDQSADILIYKDNQSNEYDSFNRLGIKTKFTIYIKSDLFVIVSDNFTTEFTDVVHLKLSNYLVTLMFITADDLDDESANVLKEQINQDLVRKKTLYDFNIVLFFDIHLNVVQHLGKFENSDNTIDIPLDDQKTLQFKVKSETHVDPPKYEAAMPNAPPTPAESQLNLLEFGTLDDKLDSYTNKSRNTVVYKTNGRDSLFSAIKNILH